MVFKVNLLPIDNNFDILVILVDVYSVLFVGAFEYHCFSLQRVYLNSPFGEVFFDGVDVVVQSILSCLKLLRCYIDQNVVRKLKSSNRICGNRRSG